MGTRRRTCQKDALRNVPMDMPRDVPGDSPRDAPRTVLPGPRSLIDYACLLYTSDAADYTPCGDLGGR
eukprot:5120023-Pyramimonas_sp.AAC.1